MQNDEDFPLTTAASITSELDSIDDLNYFEWEKERRLFQEYIASLRKEIRVLLQERFEYRTNTNDDESTKIELLQKCLEEKNLLIEQYQNENELLKEKNNNFQRQISVHKAETKSHLTMIDESKQKIIDLTIDLENHQMVKRRLESSIHNLEEECRLIDGERQKLLEDLKESQHTKQQMEKTLQIAHVQIAEQGSTIEMLRAENIQVRSQLASIQRRMFQEKQQIIDYLRQIENDLIEKERIEKQCRNLQMQIDRLNDETTTRFRTNFDEFVSLSQCSNVDEMIETTRNRWIDERKTHDELQKELLMISSHCAQLEFANQSWQQFQQIQMENLRKKFDSFVSIRSDSSFDEILQLIVDELSQLQRRSSSSSSNEENLEESLRETFREFINDENHDDLVRQIQNGFEQRSREYQTNLETIRQSYLNTVNELNQEIDILKQQRDDQTFVEFSTPIDFNEISSLSNEEISSRLNNECRQILSNESSLPTDQLIPLAFYTIKYLHNQYLVAQAKDMYNDTVIRALKDEFEVLLVEKNDLAEQFEKVKSETSSQINANEKSFEDIPMVRHEQFEQIKDEEKGSDWTEDEDLFRSRSSDVEQTKLKFEMIEDRLERLAVESSSLFSQTSTDPIDRLDQLINYLRQRNRDEIDDQALNKQIQINQKLKRALQMIKEKVQRFVHERPEDFSQTTDETIERLEQIFTLIHRQTNDIDQFKEILREKTDELRNASILNEEKQTQLNHLENELNHLRSTMPSPALAEDFQMFSKLVEEQAEQLKNLTEENQSIAHQLQSQTEFYQQQNEKLKRQLIEYQDETAKRRVSLQERSHQESQTDHQQYDKLVQMNNKMKRFLQAFKEKIQHFVSERPDLFDGVGEETNERLDHLISTIPSIEHRLNAQIDHWKRSLETLQNQLDSEEKLQAVQLKQSISQKDEERNLLLEQVERLEAELKKCQDEKDTLDQQQQLQLGQSREEIEQVETEASQTIQERDDQIKDLKTQLDHFLSERQSLVMQLNDYQRVLQEAANKVDRESQTDHQQYDKLVQMNNKMKRFLQAFKEKIQHFVSERPDLFDGVGEETNERLDHLISTIPSIEHRLNAQIDHWKQSFDTLQNLQSAQLTQSQDDIEKLRNETRQTASELDDVREQMHKLTAERDELQGRVDELSVPSVVTVDKASQIDDSDYEMLSNTLREMAEVRSDLFDGVGEDAKERLSHLISVVPSLESRLQAEVDQWKRSCEALEERIDAEQKLKVEHLQQASNTESSVQQLQRILSDKEDERKLIRQRLNELEIELRKTLDENQKLVQDKKSLIEKHSEIMKEKEEQVKLAEESVFQCKESCESLLEERDQQCTDLQRINDSLSKERDDLERRINEYQRRIELLTIPAVETLDGMSQTDHRSADVLSEKIAEFAQRRADLFENVGEETSDRIDHLISMTSSLADLKRCCENQQHEIDELKQIISKKEEERDLIRKQLDEAERQLKKTLSENAKLVEEKNTLIHQHISQTESSQQQYETIEHSAQQTAAKIEKLEILLGQRDNELEELEERVQTLTVERDEFRKTVDRLASQLEEVVHERNQVNSHDHQILLEKLQRIVTERPDLFAGVGDEAKERLDHLISTIPLIENRLKAEVDYWKKSCETLEDQMESEQKLKVEHLQQASNSDSFMQQLQRTISDKEEEQHLTRQQLEKVELELRKARDENGRLLGEKEALIHQQSLKLEQQQSELDTLRDTLRDSQEKIEKLESVLEDRDASLEMFDEETRLLKSQRNELQQQVTELTVPPRVTSEVECQTDNRHYEKLVEMNKKMKRHLQVFNETIGNVMSERPELFDGVGQDVNERLRHLISIVPSIESRLQAEVDHWKRSCEALEEIIDAEQKLKVELQTSLDQNKQFLQQKQTLIIEHSAQLDQQQQQIETMSQNIEKLESLVEQRDAALERFDEENRTLKSQRDELKDEVVQLTVPARVLRDDGCGTDNEEFEKMEADVSRMKETLEKVVKERVELFDGVGAEVNERVDRLIESMALIDQWKNCCESQRMEMEQLQLTISEKDENVRQQINEIKQELKKVVDEKEVLVCEHNQCREELENLRQTSDELEALKKEFGALKSEKEALAMFVEDLKQMEEKIDELINERSDLFVNVGEKPAERLDHIISTLKSECQRTSEKPLESIEDRRVSSRRIESTNLKKNQSESFVDLTAETTTDEDGWFDASPDIVSNETTLIESKIRRFIVEHSSLFRNESTNFSDDVDQLLFVINELDDELRRYLSSPMNLPTGHDANTQTLGLSIVEEHRKQIENLQEKLARLESERTNSLSSLRHNVEIQTIENNDSETTTAAANGISRRIFEEEMLASSKEIQQLKRLVKQMKIENEKIKEINRKFEAIAQNVLHENQQLKRENDDHRISLPRNRFDDVSSDEDICYLTLKCLTYEVSNQTSIDQQIEEDFNECQRQLKQTRLQNERLKNQIENYKKQFEQIQLEMSKQIDQMTKLKDETEKSRSSEIHNRSEYDRLKSDHYDQQLRIQQLERELNNSRRTHLDERSRNNLEELVQLKEREIVALKEKFDRTVAKHRIELEESMKSKQFSLEHVQRLEQIDQRHQQTRRNLEKKLSQFCRLTRPLTQRFDDLIELKSLIDQTENEERVNSSLAPIRDCLSLLEAQMKDLHHNIIENHARRSKRWKYRLGFECLSCESRWEVTHDIHDLQEACSDPSRFLESSMVEPMAGCSCPIMIDFVESDVRLCLDDLVDDVIEQISSTVN